MAWPMTSPMAFAAFRGTALPMRSRCGHAVVAGRQVVVPPFASQAWAGICHSEGALPGRAARYDGSAGAAPFRHRVLAVPATAARVRDAQATAAEARAGHGLGGFVEGGDGQLVAVGGVWPSRARHRPLRAGPRPRMRPSRGGRCR
ncbi:hypothetical protein G6F35_014220 [Rhizopus arrhizus]|nr:hypothetical protein G6F35_014220 [Rhizopus arrhizus]